MSVLFTFLAGIVMGVILSYAWRQWREVLIVLVIGVSLGNALGALGALIIGSSSSIHRPDNPAMCWVVTVTGLAIAFLSGLLLWKMSRKAMLRERREERLRYYEKLNRAYS